AGSEVTDRIPRSRPKITHSWVAFSRRFADIGHMGSRTPAKGRLSARLPHLLVVVAVLALGASFPLAQAEAVVYQVTDEASFAAAIAKARSGDTISLAPGTYAPLMVERRSFTNPVRIVGSRDT